MRASNQLSVTSCQRAPARHLRSGFGRHGFTLIELTVAVAILIGLLTMVGMVFQTAGKASGQAQSSTTLYRRVLTAADIIRQDLEKVDPTKGALGIAGVEIAAADNEAERMAAKADTSGATKLPVHRADVLMLLTTRTFEPYVYQAPSSNPINSFGAVRQVVYGHADVGQLDPSDPDNKWLPGSIKRLEGSQLPGQSDMLASEWHLARRVVGFPERALYPEDSASPIKRDQPGVYPRTGSTGDLTDADILEGKADVFGFPLAASGPSMGLTGLSQSGVFKYGASDGSYLYWEKPNPFAPDYCFWMAGSAPQMLWDPISSWWFRLVNTTATRTGPGAPTSISISTALTATVTDSYGLTTAAADGQLPGLTFYNPKATVAAGTVAAKRTLIPAFPVSGQSSRMAAYFLPACTDFKVEFTYDDPREIELVDDGSGNRVVDTRSDIDWDASGTPTPGDTIVVPHPIRWQTVPKGEQWVWSRLSVDPINKTFPFRWPRAVRITIRAYPPGKTTEGAVEQVIVHAWK